MVEKSDMRKHIIVVEGQSDTNRLRDINPDVITFETSGLGFDEDKQKRLLQLSKDYEIIVFTDPDGPGERIRTKIKELIPSAKHVFLNSNKALSKDKTKVGVEHASNEDIIEAFNQIYDFNQNSEAKYSINNLIDWGIYNSKDKRKQFCDLLNISFGNNQKVIKQLNTFNINEEKILNVLKEIKE